jgi:hypothetical protein
VAASPAALAAASGTPETDPAAGRQAASALRAEARKLLLTVPDPSDTDAAAYMDLVEKATVLLFRAAGADPEDPASFRELGRLAEIRALFARDSWDRRELMDGAQFQFARAARLEFEAAFDGLAAGAAAPSGTASGALAPSGPLISELAFAGRLRRGEATLDELVQHYQADGLSADRNPRFWADRLHIIRAGEDPGTRAALYGEAAAHFAELWKTMPVEVPWRGQPRRGPQKIRKIEVLEAWAGTVAALSGSEQDPELRSRLFLEALRLLELGLPLPLDTHETAGLLTSLDGAEPEAPDREASEALWALKDRLFARWLAAGDHPPEVNALWGDDLYARAGRQLDSRLFDHFINEGDLRYQAYIATVRADAKARAEKTVADAAAAQAAAAMAGAEISRGAGPGMKGASGRRNPAQAFRRPPAAEAAAALEEAETAARAVYRQGEALELRTGKTSEFLVSLPREELDARRRRILMGAAAGYQEALDLSPGSIHYMRALSRASLQLAALSPTEEGFLPHFEQALSLALSAASREPDTGGAFFGWGRSVMAASESIPFPAVRERMTAEALAAFRQNLRSHSPFVPELNEMADLVYRAARSAPGQKAQAYRLLTEICRRLAALRPDDPDTRFALSLAMLLRIAAESPQGAGGDGDAGDGGSAVASGSGGSGGADGNFGEAAARGANGGSRAYGPSAGAGPPGEAGPGPASPHDGAPRSGSGQAGAYPRDARAAEPGNAYGPAPVTGGQGGPGAAAAPPPPPGADAAGAPAGTLPPGTADLPAPWNSSPDSVDRGDFRELLNAAGEGLELLSMGEEPRTDPGTVLPPDPLEPFRRDPARIRFLEPENFLRVNLSSATRAERNASSLNAFVGRMQDLAPPESMGPWHMLRLASFLRRSAATGYLPPEEEKAYFRLSLRILSEAETLLRSGGDAELVNFVLAEKGLALAESTLGGGTGEGGTEAARMAEEAAVRLWDEADAAEAGSSAYARARWAARSGDREELGRHLAHSARDEDLMLWPKFREALLEPAFRPYAGEGWFKSLWFGYGRHGAASAPARAPGTGDAPGRGTGEGTGDAPGKGTGEGTETAPGNASGGGAPEGPGE